MKGLKIQDKTHSSDSGRLATLGQWVSLKEASEAVICRRVEQALSLHASAVMRWASAP